MVKIKHFHIAILTPSASLTVEALGDAGYSHVVNGCDVLFAIWYDSLWRRIHFAPLRRLRRR